MYFNNFSHFNHFLDEKEGVQKGVHVLNRPLKVCLLFFSGLISISLSFERRKKEMLNIRVAVVRI